MFNLDSLAEIKELDKGNILGSVQELPNQCLHAWEDASKIDVPEYYHDIKNIIMCGMGGSGLGARVIESVYSDSINYPFYRLNDYHLPGFCDIHSLVICSSYSGETEETIQNAKEAINKKTKWMAIASGNSLIQLAQQEGVPYYQIDPKYNPSNQPRMAIGYSVIGQLVLASKAGLFSLDKKNIDNAVDSMNAIKDKNDVSIGIKDNFAKKLAQKIYGKIVIFISSGHLVGATHVVNNQQNECAKNLSFDVSLPELNHHLMEGLKFPSNNPAGVYVIFIDSDLYEERIKKRVKATMDVVAKNKIDYSSFKPSSSDELSQAFELIQFGGYLNYYLALLNKIDPLPIPWVDYFKIQLGQPLGK